MLDEVLFPCDLQLRIDQVEIDPDATMVVSLSSAEITACCPYCGMSATRSHSRYRRYAGDLSCLGYVVRPSLRVRRFFCDNTNCRYLTFAEQFSGLLQPCARRTSGLALRQQQIAFEVGGEAGARILSCLSMPVSPDTLIRLVRSAPDPELSTPQILGVDDWASRKGVVYGTILVDLEKRKAIDLLPERSAVALETWLREHAGVTIIARDRGGEYINGASAGAPAASQIADRWHLLENVREMLEQFLQNRRACLQAAAEVDREVSVVTETARRIATAATRL